MTEIYYSNEIYFKDPNLSLYNISICLALCFFDNVESETHLNMNVLLLLSKME